MKTTFRVLLELLLLVALTLTWFNYGVSFGQDTAFCVANSLHGVHEKVPVDEDPFCERVQPENALVANTLRMAWVNIFE